jgi:hypothetical protein
LYWLNSKILLKIEQVGVATTIYSFPGMVVPVQLSSPQQQLLQRPSEQLTYSSYTSHYAHAHLKFAVERITTNDQLATQRQALQTAPYYYYSYTGTR